MAFLQERKAFESELDRFYATYPTDIGDLNRRMSETSGRHPEWSPYRRKALIYETAAAHCQVRLFRHSPFYYELKAGRSRDWWGFGGVGAWMLQTPFGVRYHEACDAWKKPWDVFVSFNGRTDTDLDHHAAGYDNVLRLGLNGIVAKCESRLAETSDARERSFLKSAVIGLNALIAISNRFADRADTMLKAEIDPVVRRRLERIAVSARRSPANPPETFFEALNALIFVREILGSIEGIGISTFGHVDRMLHPYYEADLAAGRIDREEAKDLLSAFLAFTDVKFESRRACKETSTTVFIGGCEADGTPVFNDVTCMVVEVFRELGLINPKFQARIVPGHPEAYFDLVSDFIAAGTNVMAVYNDPVIIDANVRSGKRVEDARLYVGGGCQENILQNTEISSRATMFFNLPVVLDMGMFPERWAAFAAAEGLELASHAGCATFDELYEAFLGNLCRVVGRLIENRNRYESDSRRYNPCPLLSSTLADCIENARDMTEGGCRYSTASVDMAGIGTLVDSLYALREVVFERKDIPLRQFLTMVAGNFEGEEAFRQYLLNRVPKFGRDGTDARRDGRGVSAFAARVFADIAAATSGRANSRGGTYLASLFAHRSNVSLGKLMGATPDGRKAGTRLSQSMGPSLEALGRRSDIGGVLSALEPLDLTDYPVVAILDLKLPALNGDQGTTITKSVIKRFVASGGSVLQLNVVDTGILREAKAHPERHPDLAVRVSGFSAYFSTLTPEVQEEIINRTEMHSGETVQRLWV